MARFERVFELPSRTLSRWKTGDFSASSLVQQTIPINQIIKSLPIVKLHYFFHAPVNQLGIKALKFILKCTAKIPIFGYYCSMKSNEILRFYAISKISRKQGMRLIQLNPIKGINCA